jgi:hypothetical protein
VLPGQSQRIWNVSSTSYGPPMGTVHEDAALALLEEWDSDPEGVAILPIYVEGLRTGRWARDYLDAIGQLHRVEPFRWPRHQVAAFALMHHYLMSGLAASVQINVDGTPYPDAERDANASALADLPAPFTAHLSRTQHHADQDGWLEWHSPITANRSIGEACYSSASDNPEPILVRHVIPPGRVPLEVGSTLPSRTYLHTYADCGVARWPYDATRIRLFVSSKFPHRMFPLGL